jgi:hypothetical protein
MSYVIHRSGNHECWERWLKAMLGNIVVMFPVREARLSPQTAEACTELLAQTIEFLDKQIVSAKELLSTDRAHLLLRAIEAHIADKLGASLTIPGEQS